MPLKVSLIHPGTQHAAHLAKELNKQNLLKYFVTSIAWTPKHVLIKLVYKLRPTLIQKLANRIITNINPKQLITYPLSELSYLITERRSKQSKEYLLYIRNKKFQKNISKYIIKESDVVIGYDTSSWLIAEKTKIAGKKFILDQTIGHPIAKEKFYTALKIKYSEWNAEDQIIVKDKFLLNLEKSEHDIADAIVVPSLFVKDTLTQNGVLEDKIYINPFGTNLERFKNLHIRDYNQPTFNFLFVGTLNARKGLPDLIKAWIELKPQAAQLWIAGFGNIPIEVQNKITDTSIKFLGKINKDELPDLYNHAHAFIFPSYFEGLAQVQIEALCCGLPVIGTTNSGATEIITDGLNGFIIEPGNISELKNKINWMMDNKIKVKTMSINAEKSSKKLGWHEYGLRWKSIIEKVAAKC